MEKNKLYEDLTKTEVNSMIDNKLDSHLSDREFKKVVKEITTEVLEEFFRTMWNKKNFWKTGLTNV